MSPYRRRVREPVRRFVVLALLTSGLFGASGSLRADDAPRGPDAGPSSPAPSAPAGDAPAPPTGGAAPWTAPISPEADPPPRAAPPAPDALGVIRLPHVTIDVKRRRIEAEAKICLRQGLVEVLACRGNGKTHESVLRFEGTGRDLKLGLIALGLVERPQVKNLGDPGELTGDRVILHVSWEEEGRTVRHRAEDLVLDHVSGATMDRVGFVFTGSRFVKVGTREVFMADASGQIVTTFHDPDAILDNPLAKGGDDTIYYANNRILPSVGTPVVVTMEPADAVPGGIEAPRADAPSAASRSAQPIPR